MPIPPPPRFDLPGVSYVRPQVEQAPPVHGARRLRAVMEEMARRNCEALKLYVPFGESLRFHKSQAKTRIIIGSVRSGKTNAATSEAAMCATGTHPWRKFPKENAKLYIVGWDQEFIGKVLVPKMLEPGAFRIIRDEVTKKWRPVLPDQEYDKANQEKWRDSPPFLPPRFVKSINWESRKDNVARDIELINGTRLSYYSSKGAPQRGSEIDFAMVSEEMENKSWPRELQRALVKRGGCFVYEATPISGSSWLWNAYQSAHIPGADQRLIETFSLYVKNNIYISEQDRQDFFNGLQTDQERRVYWDGEFMLGEAIVYPEFKRDVHVVESFEPPDEWNRYMVVDPGVTVCAVTFWAVPPPKGNDGKVSPRWHERHCFDELYIKRCSAAVLAEQVKSKMGRWASGGFQAFLIDGRMGRQSQMGSGRTVQYEYAEALRERGVYSRMTGSDFLRGSDNIQAREQALRSWFSPPYSDEPTPILRVHDKCRMLLWELPQQLYKQDQQGLVINDQRIDKNNHATATCFADDVEVLTGAGWKLFRDVLPTERFLTVNLEDDLYEYQKAEFFIQKRHSGDMVQFGGTKGSRIDMLVTPDHRMVVHKKKFCGRKGEENGYKGYGPPEIRLAGEVSHWDTLKATSNWAGMDPVQILVPKAGRNGEDKFIDAGDFAEFLGWFVAEGSVDKTVRMPGKGYRTTVSQKKESGRAALEPLLAKMPWKWHPGESGYVASSCQLWTYLHRQVGAGFAKKRVPQWVKDSTPEIIERFLKGAIAGDGHVRPNGTRCYFTSNKLLADDFQELFLKVGRTARVSNRGRRDGEIRGRKFAATCDGYVLIEKFGSKSFSLRDFANKPNFRTVQYRGMVYCVTVPNGTLVVRRNGCPIVAGNCEYFADFNPAYISQAKPDKPLSAGVKAFRAKKAKQKKTEGSVSLGPPPL